MSKTISQFQEHAGGCVVKQRTLRCGREGNLFCMHLIDESAFLNFLLKKQTTAYPFRNKTILPFGRTADERSQKQH